MISLVLISLSSLALLSTLILISSVSYSKRKHSIGLGWLIPQISVHIALMVVYALDFNMIALSINTLTWIISSVSYTLKRYSPWSVLPAFLLLCQNALFLFYQVDSSLPFEDLKLSLPCVSLIFSFCIFLMHLLRKPHHDDGRIIVDGRMVLFHVFFHVLLAF